SGLKGAFPGWHTAPPALPSDSTRGHPLRGVRGMSGSAGRRSRTASAYSGAVENPHSQCRLP
ncbi:hypothetical protein BGU93_19140, partial [Clostridioides difficile]